MEWKKNMASVYSEGERTRGLKTWKKKNGKREGRMKKVWSMILRSIL